MGRTSFSIIVFFLFGCFLSISISTKGDILDGLVSYWAMEDGDGGAANDIASGLDGELFGDPQWVPGKVGGGLDCDGDGDYVSCGFSSLLMSDEEITIQVWANITEFGNYAAIIGNVQDTGFFEGGYWLGTSIGGFFGLGITTNGAIEPYQWTPPIYNTGQWYHLVVTYKSEEMRLWVDGSLADGINNTIRTGQIDYTHLPFRGFVMARYWDDDELFEQALIIDEVAVWDRRISEEEIAWLYNEGMGNPIVNPEPKSGATLVPVDAVLSWTSRDTTDVAGYDVYFGIDPNGFLNNKVLDGQNVTTFSPQMQYGQTYYWRVDVIENANPGPGTVTHKGLTYSFSTISLLQIVDFNGDCRVDLIDFGLFAESWLECNLVSPYDVNGDCRVDFNDFTLFAESWLESYLVGTCLP